MGRNRLLQTGIALLLLLLISLPGAALAKSDKIIVAYFPGWPGTFQYGWSQGLGC